MGEGEATELPTAAPKEKWQVVDKMTSAPLCAPSLSSQ